MNEPLSDAEDSPIEVIDAAAEERARQTAGAFRRFALLIAAALGVLGLVVLGTMFTLYRAATAAVPEYEAAVEVDPAEAEAERQALESQLSALFSDTQTLPEWTSRLTARQINGWLAIRLRRDFPGFLEAGLLAPRVMLGDGTATVAARSKLTRIDGVVSVTVRPTVSEAGELVLDIVSAKIGRLSLPLDALLAQLRETPLEQIAPIRWAQNESQTAVIVDLERIDTGRDRTLRLSGVDIRPGELLLRGQSIDEQGAAVPTSRSGVQASSVEAPSNAP